VSESIVREQTLAHLCTSAAPLKERLRSLDQELRRVAPDFADAYDELVARLRAAGTGGSAPRPDELMPAFFLPNVSGSLVSLADVITTGPVVINLSRGHWCEFGQIELAALAQCREQLEMRNTRVVVITPEAREFVRRATARHGNFCIALSDKDSACALTLGLVIWMGTRIRRLCSEHRINLPKYQGNDSWFVPIAATFVVGQDGRVIARHVDPDFRKRMDPTDILATLDAAGSTSTLTRR
jgi:peroxiredoxin